MKKPADNETSAGNTGPETEPNESYVEVIEGNMIKEPFILRKKQHAELTEEQKVGCVFFWEP